MTEAQIDEGSMTNSSSPSGHAAGREAPADPPDPQLRDILTAMRAANVAPAHIADAEAPIIVLGDSAGGNLATVVARRFRDRWSNRIALQVLVYPVTDHRMKTH